MTLRDEINLLEASLGETAAIEEIVGLLRMGVMPLFNSDPDNLHVNQSYAITAAAIFAGTTVGHLIALGLVKEQDKRRLGEMMLKNFRSGIEIGKREAQRAILEQSTPKGSA